MGVYRRHPPPESEGENPNNRVLLEPPKAILWHPLAEDVDPLDEDADDAERKLDGF